MSEYASPGKRSFFKYLSPATALAVLENRTFRYNSPLVFNDPFDIQAGLHFDFDISQLHTKILDGLERIASSEERPTVNMADPWGKVVDLVWTIYPTHGFPRDRWEHELAGHLGQLAEVMRETQQQYADGWQKLLPRLRVFCVSEERDNLLMWAHYTKDHTGIVIEILSLPEEDNPLSVAQPITYQKHPPPFFTEQEWLDDMLLQRDLDQHALFRRYAQTKSVDWAYEKEWRVWYPSSAESGEKWVDTPIRPSEIRAIYIGCNAEPHFAKQVQSLAVGAFPNTEIYKASKKDGQYALSHQKI